MLHFSSLARSVTILIPLNACALHLESDSVQVNHDRILRTKQALISDFQEVSDSFELNDDRLALSEQLRASNRSKTSSQLVSAIGLRTQELNSPSAPMSPLAALAVPSNVYTKLFALPSIASRASLMEGVSVEIRSKLKSSYQRWGDAARSRTSFSGRESIPPNGVTQPSGLTKTCYSFSGYTGLL